MVPAGCQSDGVWYGWRLHFSALPRRNEVLRDGADASDREAGKHTHIHDLARQTKSMGLLRKGNERGERRMQRFGIGKQNCEDVGKIFKFRTVNFKDGLDIISWSDDLEHALASMKEYEAEYPDSDVFITVWDDNLGRYIMTRYGK